MTSGSTDAATKAHFEEHGFFGLDRDQVAFFQQVSAAAGRSHCRLVLLGSPVALSPTTPGACQAAGWCSTCLKAHHAFVYLATALGACQERRDQPGC